MIRDGGEFSLKVLAAAVLMTIASGFVDTFCFLTLGRVFTSHVTGNTIMIGVYAFAQRGNLLLHVFSVLMFFTGLVAGALLIRLSSRSARRGFVLALFVEALLLAALIATIALAPASIQGSSCYGLVCLAAVAMGVQNTSLGASGLLSEYTTHITGTLTKLAGHAVATVLRDAGRRSEARAALLCASLCAGFLGGALMASALWSGARVFGLLIPLAIVLGIALVDVVAPFPRRAG